MFDQINAGHREAVAAAKRARLGLALMSEEEQRAFIDSLDPSLVELLNELAPEEETP